MTEVFYPVADFDSARRSHRRRRMQSVGLVAPNRKCKCDPTNHCSTRGYGSQVSDRRISPITTGKLQAVKEMSPVLHSIVQNCDEIMAQGNEHKHLPY